MKITAIGAILFTAMFVAAIVRYLSCLQMFPGIPPLAIYANAPPIMMWSITASAVAAIVAFVMAVKGMQRSREADTNRNIRTTLVASGVVGLAIAGLAAIHGYTVVARFLAIRGAVSPMVTAPAYAEISLALAVGFLAAAMSCAGLALFRDRSDPA